VVPLLQIVPNVTPVNSKIFPAKKRVKIAPSVITKTKSEYRIALAAFLGSTKMKQARVRVNIAPKTRQQPIANVPHHVTLAVRAGHHQTEACLVRNVWPEIGRAHV
jgi:hypothetical protein